jgi:hypothetical protein
MAMRVVRSPGGAAGEAAAILLLAGLSCGRGGGPAAPAPAATATSAAPAPTAAPAASASGLGELMALQQVRHAKLWLAGDARNWGLAGYEWKELQEGFADIERLYPTRPDSPVPIDQAVETMMTDPLQQLGEAIGKKDAKAFAAAFDMLTEGCNSCHQATNHAFTVLQRPKTNPFPNQSFAPPK